MNPFYGTVAAAATVTITLLAADARIETRLDDHFTARLMAANERPTPVNSMADGVADIVLLADGLRYSVTVNGLDSPPTAAHIHGPGGPNDAVSVLVPFGAVELVTNGTVASGMIPASNLRVSIDSLRKLFLNGMAYVNVHTTANPAGAMRGQLVPVP